MVKASKKVEYAGFWIRFLAGFVDNTIISIMFAVLFAVGISFYFGFDFFKAIVHKFLFIVALGIIIGSSVIYYLYFAIFQSSPWQATIGMKGCGLKITDTKFKRISFWRALGRELCAILSEMILYIGYFMIAFTEKKQGLHDMIAGTYVIKNQKA